MFSQLLVPLPLCLLMKGGEGDCLFHLSDIVGQAVRCHSNYTYNKR
jgi:hypothetical protein